MANWTYRREENERDNSALIGKHRCVITAVEEAVSKTSGLPMIVVTVRPSGCRFTVRSYIVQNENFNRNMTQFFDSFIDIGEGNFNFVEWVGAIGAANFKEDESGYLRVGYWISSERAYNLPAFEGDVPERQTVTSLDDDDDPGVPLAVLQDGEEEEDGFPFE